MRIYILLVLILFQTCRVSNRTFPDGYTRACANHDRHGRLRYVPQSVRFRQQIDDQIRRSSQDTSISDRSPFTAQPACVQSQLSAATFSGNTSLHLLMRLQL
jgi:hypothetical protein